MWIKLRFFFLISGCGIYTGALNRSKFMVHTIHYTHTPHTKKHTCIKKSWSCWSGCWSHSTEQRWQNHQIYTNVELYLYNSQNTQKRTPTHSQHTHTPANWPARHTWNPIALREKGKLATFTPIFTHWKHSTSNWNTVTVFFLSLL